MPPTSTITDNVQAARFELTVDGAVAFAAYRLGDDGVLYINHVETPPALRGGGVAGQVMQGVVENARKRGLKIRPICGYAASWMHRHPEHADLLA